MLRRSQTVHGDPVLPISLPYIYKMAHVLKPLGSIQDDTTISSNLYTLYTAAGELNKFLFNSIYTDAIRAARAPGVELLSIIQKLTEAENHERNISVYEIYMLGSALQQFETVLIAELNVGHAFWVTKKRGYDTYDLINQAEVIFPQELIAKVPESIADIRESGRCIAFELGTAAGFHTMRALEIVLRRYFDVVTNGAPRPKTNNMGDYLSELDRLAVGDVKTKAALKQIKNLHRNELIHPEVTLSLDEAIGLWNMAQSVIVAMLSEIPGQEKLLAGT